MGVFSELDMERKNSCSEEAAPAGFSMEDETATLESQAFQMQVSTVEQPAAVDAVPEASTDAVSNDGSGTGVKDVPEERLKPQSPRTISARHMRRLKPSARPNLTPNRRQKTRPCRNSSPNWPL